MKHLLKVSPLFVCAVVAVVAVSLMANPAAFDQIKGGTTYKCTACVPASQCSGISHGCSDQGLCLYSCDDAYSYNSANQCSGTSTSDCSNSGSPVTCKDSTVCVCTFYWGLFSCASFSGPYDEATVNPC